MIQRFHDLVESAKWTFAKTQPYNPHEYMLRKNFQDDKDFVWMVEYIRKYGVEEEWKAGRKFTYLYLNGWQYWTMGAPINLNGEWHTILINRAKYNAPVSVYDPISKDYEKYFSMEEYKKEDDKLFRLIRPSSISGRVLDIGSGTGLFLDHVLIHKDKYTGVDSSRGMLDVLKSKYPDYKVIHDYFGRVYAGKFDNIFALYGTASYLSQREIDLIQEMLNPGGKYFLMFYKYRYYPITHEVFNIPYEDQYPVALPEDAMFYPFGNYDIYTNRVLHF